MHEDSEPAIIKITKKEKVQTMERRTFSAEFKAKIVLQVISGEKELNAIANENQIGPSQIRNWNKSFSRMQLQLLMIS